MRAEAPPPPAAALPPPRPALRRRLLLAAAAIAAAVVGLFFVRGPADLALLLPLVLGFSLASAALRWIRTENPRAEATSRLRERVADYGGGFYGTAGLSTFVYLEARALQDTWAPEGTLRDFVMERAAEWFWGFGIASVMNVVRASIWPLHWMQAHGLLATVVGAAAAWLLYRLALRLTTGRWDGGRTFAA